VGLGRVEKIKKIRKIERLKKIKVCLYRDATPSPQGEGWGEVNWG
jgi:hypothetical protein